MTFKFNLVCFTIIACSCVAGNDITLSCIPVWVLPQICKECQVSGKTSCKITIIFQFFAVIAVMNKTSIV